MELVRTCAGARSLGPRECRRRRLEQLVLAAEDLAYGVVDEDAPYRVGQELGAGEHADVVWSARSVCDRDRVGDDDLLDARGAQVCERIAGEDGVRGGRIDPVGA